MSFKLLFSIIFVSLLLSASVLGYRLFLMAPDPSAVAPESATGVTSQGLSETGEATSADPDAMEFARLLQSISSISSLNSNFLDEAVFMSLVNFPYPIPTPTPGRNNPFAPVGTP